MRVTEAPTTVYQVTKMNRRRLINVLFGDVIRPLLATRGQTLSKDDLNDSLKTDQVLHEKVIVEYNRTNVYSYDNDAHPDVQSGPNNFLATGDITWERSLSTTKDMTKEYEFCHTNWKRSGQHEDFADGMTVPEMNKTCLKPFSDFTHSNKSMKYLHAWISQFPNILKIIMGKSFNYLYLKFKI